MTTENDVITRKIDPPLAASAAALDDESARTGLLAGRYRVERTLGKGGGGYVLAASHATLGHRVAIKLLLPGALANAEAVTRFEREARIAARLRNPHVVRVYDFGRTHTGVPFLVMELLEGLTLAEYIQRHGPPPVERAVDWILQACDGLGEAHALGITHRDLKPSNLFLVRSTGGVTGETCTVKVIDFGISKMQSEKVGRFDPSTITDSKTVMGSPGFMSPEQMRSSRDVDARTDIWALGATLYQALAGRPAFDVDTLPDLYAAVLLEPPRPMDAPDRVPAALEQVVLRCLEKRPEERYANVAELAAALAPFASGGAHPSGELAVAHTVRYARSRRAFRFAVPAFMALVLAAGTAAATHGEDLPTSAELHARAAHAPAAMAMKLAHLPEPLPSAPEPVVVASVRSIPPAPLRAPVPSAPIVAHKEEVPPTPAPAAAPVAPTNDHPEFGDRR